jgi:phytol kinase
MLQNDFIALAVTFGLSLLWLRLNDYTAHRGWVSSRLSRKIIHIGTGPLFVLCWLLFTPAASARYLAALVPLAITVQFFLVGTGVIRDEAAVRAMSRSGDRGEILKGPLFYGLIFVAITILYWRSSPIGIIALMLMCGGDGLADVFGRGFHSSPLPWNRNKTWAGSLGMLAGGWVCAAVILAVYLQAGLIPGALSTYWPAITLIALAGTLVESLPLKDMDNITVTLTAVGLGHLLL